VVVVQLLLLLVVVRGSRHTHTCCVALSPFWVCCIDRTIRPATCLATVHEARVQHNTPLGRTEGRRTLRDLCLGQSAAAACATVRQVRWSWWSMHEDAGGEDTQWTNGWMSFDNHGGYLWSRSDRVWWQGRLQRAMVSNH
jgi:hypothetical protein